MDFARVSLSEEREMDTRHIHRTVESFGRAVAILLTLGWMAGCSALLDTESLKSGRKDSQAQDVPVDAPGIDAKVDAPKPKLDGLKPQLDAPKPQLDAPKPKLDAPRHDWHKHDSTKHDGPKLDAPKVDAPKADAPKADAPGIDGPTPDTQLTDGRPDQTPSDVTPQ
jgi:hypothetical protein